MTASKENCEMLPCPLCGRQPDYQHFNISQNTRGRIICTCGLGLTQGRNDTEDGTILKWNTRSDHAVQAANERKAEQAIAATVGNELWEPSKEWKAWHESLRHDNPTSIREAVENILYEAIDFGGDMGPNGNVCSGVDEGDVLTDGCINGWVKSIEAITATVGNGTDLASRLREVTGLHAFAELFGFDWSDGSDWDWHDVACAMADAIDATAGVVPETKYLMALDEARKSNMDAERWERIARDHQSKCRSLKETNADLRRIIDDMKAVTVGNEPDEATMLKLHSRMNAALLDMNEELLAYHQQDRENASSKELIDCVIRAHQIIEDAAVVGVGTCRNVSDPPSGFLCSECGWGDFNEPTHLLKDAKFTDNDRGPNYCPNCGRRCIG